MPRSCPRCGIENRLEAVFCRECGLSLTDAEATPGETGERSPLSERAGRESSPADEASASQPPTGTTPAAPGRSRRRNTLGIVTSILLILALVGAGFLWFQLARLQDRHQALQADLEQTNADLATSREDLEEAEEQVDDLEDSFDLCQEASAIGERFLDTAFQLYVVTSRQQAGRLFRKMAALSEDWEDGMRECLEQ